MVVTLVLALAVIIAFRYPFLKKMFFYKVM